jgi:hypothetical protein
VNETTKDAAPGESPSAADDLAEATSSVGATDLQFARRAIRKSCPTFELTPENLAATCRALIDNDVPLLDAGLALIGDEWWEHDVWPDAEIAKAYTVALCEAKRSRHAPLPKDDDPEELDFTEEPPAVEWLVDKVFETDAVHMLFGPPSAMKTMTMLSLCAAIITGEPWLGRFPVKQGNVLYLDWESSQHGITRRMRKMLKGRGAKGFFYKRHWGSLHDPQGFWPKVEAFCRQHNIVAVVYDTLAAGSKGSGVEENSPAFSTPMVNAGQIDGVTHFFLHHPTKADAKNPRGTGALVGDVDSMYGLEKVKGSRQAALTTTMRLEKPGDGEQEEVIHLRFTDADGLQIVEKIVAQPPEMPLEQRIELQLLAGPKGNAQLARALGVGRPRVKAETDAMEEKGKIWRQHKTAAWQCDDHILRRKRVLALWPDRVSYMPLSMDAICKDAFVRAEAVSTLVADGTLIPDAAGKYTPAAP